MMPYELRVKRWILTDSSMTEEWKQPGDAGNDGPDYAERIE